MMGKTINDDITEVLMSIHEVNQRITKRVNGMLVKKGEHVNGKNKTTGSNHLGLRPTH
ncbi:hypothetical protein H1220_04450 [Carnobacteriaceae bacterium zg-84]|uniref:hypothetical protein n=1 Tax=Granulicatella sp. zg-84 TaxID=2678503 RepID=UPI0013BF3A01|nr:hypothetical protein [Granulicatella sp. zg-84]NEW66071.1 hypothetical protein [Granulicatella sp. zg-84]QMI86601.1 hypothetical protein H1220_04450 [Carnobacteriaceae bacterium zg-84]